MARTSSHSLSDFLLGLVLGFLAGGVLALLISPQSGEENRKSLKRATESLTDGVKEEVSNPYGKTQRFIEKQRFELEKHWEKLQQQVKAQKVAAAKAKEEEAHPPIDEDPIEAV